MSAVEIALPRLKIEEGFRSRTYKDTNGIETIGYGFNLQAGITPFAAAALLTAQMTEAHIALLRLPWYAALDEVRQSVCLDIDINEGEGGLLKFPHMISALARKDWPTAATECAVTDPKLEARYTHLSQILLTGVAT
jgi:GH24 family phage-related lysozyme (muramidase)